MLFSLLLQLSGIAHQPYIMTVCDGDIVAEVADDDWSTARYDAAVLACSLEHAMDAAEDEAAMLPAAQADAIPADAECAQY